ncbi:right-handed parallel beta-helix repeat-containing protein [Nocardioides sp. LHD-245]|nr:right-handed parallel beta-helix repeat-containing protein [Nocardioides sp. LHD-245]
MSISPDDSAKGRLPRRRVLGMAGAAVAGAGAVVVGTAVAANAAAETWLDTLTGTGDESATIQAAIDALGSTGGIIRLPAGTFQVGRTIELRTNVTITGAGARATVLREHSSLGNKAILRAAGSVGTRLTNVAVTDLTIRNATAGTTPADGPDGIFVDLVDGFALERALVTEIKGYYGLKVQRSTDIVARDCEFYRCANAMMAVLVEVDGVTVTGCRFDTLTDTTTPNCYTFMTGAETANFGSFYVRNVLVENNQFLNNPRWEGIDCHGGENIIIRGNTIKNCKVGISLQHALGFLADPSQETLRNVLIADNTIEQGSGNNDQAGISVVGNIYRMSEKIRIIGNDITGFTGQTDAPGSITVYEVRHVWIEDNELWNHGRYGICMYEAVFGATIRGNYFFGANPTAAANANSAAIGAVGPGIYGLVVEDNTVDATTMDRRVNYFIRAHSQYESWQVRNNRILNVKQATPYNDVSLLPVERSAVPTTTLVQRFGDMVYDTSGRPAWAVTAPKIGYGSLDTSTVIVKGTIASGSNTMTLVSGGALDWRAMPAGMNVTVAGAGASGAALNARVLEWAVPGIGPSRQDRVDLRHRGQRPLPGLHARSRLDRKQADHSRRHPRVRARVRPVSPPHRAGAPLCRMRGVRRRTVRRRTSILVRRAGRQPPARRGNGQRCLRPPRGGRRPALGRGLDPTPHCGRPRGAGWSRPPVAQGRDPQPHGELQGPLERGRRAHGGDVRRGAPGHVEHRQPGRLRGLVRRAARSRDAGVPARRRARGGRGRGRALRRLAACAALRRASRGDHQARPRRGMGLRRSQRAPALRQPLRGGRLSLHRGGDLPRPRGSRA